MDEARYGAYFKNLVDQYMSGALDKETVLSDISAYLDAVKGGDPDTDGFLDLPSPE